jgi:hypothetical protein
VQHAVGIERQDLRCIDRGAEQVEEPSVQPLAAVQRALVAEVRAEPGEDLFAVAHVHFFIERDSGVERHAEQRERAQRREQPRDQLPGRRPHEARAHER